MASWTNAPMRHRDPELRREATEGGDILCRTMLLLESMACGAPPPHHCCQRQMMPLHEPTCDSKLWCVGLVQRGRTCNVYRSLRTAWRAVTLDPLGTCAEAARLDRQSRGLLQRPPAASAQRLSPCGLLLQLSDTRQVCYMVSACLLIVAGELLGDHCCQQPGDVPECNLSETSVHIRCAYQAGS